MKPGRFDYHRPPTLAEAAELKASYQGEASVLAGGQSLIPMLNFRLARPQAIVDLNGIEGLAGIDVGDGSVRVRAMTRQRDLEQHEAAIRACPLLGKALAYVAHQVVRNRGTVGGSIAHADAAAELPAVLSAVDGRVRVQGVQRERWIDASDLYEFHLSTSLEEDEILVEAEFPRLPRRSGTEVLEVSRRHGDYALAGVCATLTVDPTGRVADARLAYFGVAPTTVRAQEAERTLIGEDATDEVLDAAASRARQVVEAVDEEQASVAYRRRLVEVLTSRALRETRRQASEGEG